MKITSIAHSSEKKKKILFYFNFSLILTQTFL